MTNIAEPFKFDISNLINKAQRQIKDSVDGITINLPFVSISVKPDDIEKKVAREIVIRLSDKRILNARECCESCVEKAIDSLYNIRSMLVNKQVELSSHTDGILYLIIEIMLEAIRQFQTFEEDLKKSYPEFRGEKSSILYRLSFQQYLTVMEKLRGHLYQCLKQVASVADVQIPKIPQSMRYVDAWRAEDYKLPI